MRYIEVDDDRYSGIYSGAAFTAWDGAQPNEIDADDTTVSLFWSRNIRVVGKGSTEQEAVLDLLKNLGSDAWIGWFRVIATPSAIVIPTDSNTWPSGWDNLMNAHFVKQI